MTANAARVIIQSLAKAVCQPSHALAERANANAAGRASAGAVIDGFVRRVAIQ
jgi:hypothetical protein